MPEPSAQDPVYFLRRLADQAVPSRRSTGRPQQNAALVEQPAAAAKSLRDPANALADRVSRFRLPA